MNKIRLFSKLDCLNSSIKNFSKDDKWESISIDGSIVYYCNGHAIYEPSYEEDPVIFEYKDESELLDNNKLHKLLSSGSIIPFKKFDNIVRKYAPCMTTKHAGEVYSELAK